MVRTAESNEPGREKGRKARLLFIRCWLTHVISSSTKGSDSLGAKPLHGFEVEQVVSCGHGGLSPVRKEGEEGLPGQLTIV